MRRFFAFLLCLAACNTRQAPSPTPAPASTPPVSPSVASADAVAACQNLRALRCPESLPTPAGTPCETWVAGVSTTPAGVDPVCLSHVTACDQTRRCGR